MFKNLPPIYRDLFSRGDKSDDAVAKKSDYRPSYGKRDDIYYDDDLRKVRVGDVEVSQPSSSPSSPSSTSSDSKSDSSQNERRSIKQGPMNPAMVLDIHSKPSAMVIGAGLPGIHVSYELARRGFDVSVYDVQSRSGCGNTPFMFPVVGAPFVPTGFDCFSLRQSIGNSLKLVPFCSDPWVKLPNVTSSVADRMLLTRFNNAFKSVVKGPHGVVDGYGLAHSRTTTREARREAIVHKGNALSKASARKVREMLAEHPELRAAVVTKYDYSNVFPKPSQSTVVGRIEAAPSRSFWSRILYLVGLGGKSEPNTAAAEQQGAISNSSPAAEEASSAEASSPFDPIAAPAYPLFDVTDESPLTIMPLRWTQTLEYLLATQYGVKFFYDNEVRSVSMNGSTLNPFVAGVWTTPKADQSEYTTRHADVYVYAAGASNPLFLNLMAETTPLLVMEGTAAIFETKRKDGAPPLAASSAQTRKIIDAIKATVKQSSATPSVFEHGCFFFPENSTLRYNVSEVPFSKKTSAESGMVVGGQTMTSKLGLVTKKGLPHDVFSVVLDKLFAKASADPLSRYPSLAHGSDAASTYASFDKGTAAQKDFHCYTYYKTITPDGLPIASRVGKIFNAFVIGGFGDMSPTLAPSAAEQLSHKIINPRDATLPSPLPIERYDPTNAYLAPLTESRTLEERTMDGKSNSLLARAERFLVKNITIPADALWRRFIVNLVLSPVTPIPIANYLYENHVSAEDEERVTGVKPVSVVVHNVPLIHSDTVLAPPAFNKDMDYSEKPTNVKVRDFA